MALRRVLLCVFLVLPASDTGRSRLNADSLLLARCEASCHGHEHACLTDCISTLEDKPGECPGEDSPGVIPVLEAACIQECAKDTQCPATKKCCQNSCGYTCQEADGLRSIQGLPNIPKIISVRELRKVKGKPGKTYQAKTQLSWTSSGERVFYVIEERSHAGRQFSEERLGPWATARQRPTTKTQITLREMLPGNWYVYRVSAVNGNGTRGFSEPSLPFILSLVPEPPGVPKSLRVVNIVPINGTFWGELRWDPPHSDLPIQRYKVFWSLMLLPSNPPPRSLLVRHSNVPRDRTSFILRKLDPDSQYFLQVEAYSQFGSERLKGEKGNLPFNTTHYTTGLNSWKSGKLIIKKTWKGDFTKDLKPRITWSSSKLPSSSLSKYVVSWVTTHSCANKTENTVTTKSPHFELFGLQFGCKYRVNVKEVGLGYTKTGAIYITTLSEKST